jgi:hypothetical protein
MLPAFHADAFRGPVQSSFPLGVLNASSVLARAGSTFLSYLFFGLLVAVGDHAIEERAWLALFVAIGFGLLDLAVQVGGGLFVLAFVARVVLIEVLGCETMSVLGVREVWSKVELREGWESLYSQAVLKRELEGTGWQHGQWRGCTHAQGPCGRIYA